MTSHPPGLLDAFYPPPSPPHTLCASARAFVEALLRRLVPGFLFPCSLGGFGCGLLLAISALDAGSALRPRLHVITRRPRNPPFLRSPCPFLKPLLAVPDFSAFDTVVEASVISATCRSDLEALAQTLFCPWPQRAPSLSYCSLHLGGGSVVRCGWRLWEWATSSQFALDIFCPPRNPPLSPLSFAGLLSVSRLGPTGR